MHGRLLAARARAADLRAFVAVPRVRIRARPPSARAALAGAGIVVALAVAYVAARATPLFTVRSIEVGGGPPAVADDVREALAPLEGASLVGLNPDDVAARVRAVPSVRSAWVDREFPHTLSVAVAPERPLAVVRRDERAWVVAESGRVIATTRPHGRAWLPRIRLRLDEVPTLGETLAAADAGAVLETLRRLPDPFPVRVLFAQIEEGAVVLMVEGWIELRLGPPSDLDAKLRAAGAVLRAMTADERDATGYVDAALPERVVASPDLQPES